MKKEEFNSFGARRGNHEVMIRGTFANVRINNLMVEKDGGYTKHFPSGFEGEVYEVAKKYLEQDVPLIVIAGKEYGTGSSRDWAAKGTKLLGVKAVISESFERIHRSNLIGMGILPLQFKDGLNKNKLNLKGSELISIIGIEKGITPGQDVECEIKYTDGVAKKINLLSRIDTANEVEYYKNDGILKYVLRSML